MDMRLIEPFPENIIWMYKIEHRDYPNVSFIEGLDFQQVDCSTQPSMVVVDDQPRSQDFESGGLSPRPNFS